MNHSACIGLTMTINKAPTAQPINAPIIGISAVKAIRIPINMAYGKRRIVIAIKNSEPKMHASKH